jgi:hypothetical protein
MGIWYWCHLRCHRSRPHRPLYGGNVSASLSQSLVHAKLIPHSQYVRPRGQARPRPALFRVCIPRKHAAGHNRSKDGEIPHFDVGLNRFAVPCRLASAPSHGYDLRSMPPIAVLAHVSPAHRFPSLRAPCSASRSALTYAHTHDPPHAPS